MFEISTVRGESIVLPTTRAKLWWPGVGLSAAGAGAALLVATMAHAAGASLEVAGDAIPVLDFAQLAFVLSFVGVALAATCRRWARRPANVFTWTTLTLLLLSFIPDLATPNIDTTTRIALVSSHVAVAAIVIPGLRARLR